MRSVLVSEIVRRARQRADMENSQFVTDAEIRDLICTRYAELLDRLSERDPWQYSFAEFTGSTTTGQDTYNLPSDFYKLLGVDVRDNSSANWVEIKRLHPNDRNALQSVSGWTIHNAIYFSDDREANVYYRQIASGAQDMIRFAPVPQATHQYRFSYMPHAPDSLADADSLDGINGYEEYIVILVAIDMLIKEESSTSDLERQLARFERRLDSVVDDRDSGMPLTIQDVDNSPYRTSRSFRRGRYF